MHEGQTPVLREKSIRLDYRGFLSRSPDESRARLGGVTRNDQT